MKTFQKYISLLVFLIIFLIAYLKVNIWLNRNNSVKALSNVDDDLINFCEDTGEWMWLGREIYFKKTAAYYFSDINIIFVNALGLWDLNMSQFEFVVSIGMEYNPKIEYKIQSTDKAAKIFITKFIGDYTLIAITIDLSRLEGFDKLSKNCESKKVSFNVVHKPRDIILRHPIELKIKIANQGILSNKIFISTVERKVI